MCVYLLPCIDSPNGNSPLFSEIIDFTPANCFAHVKCIQTIHFTWCELCWICIIWNKWSIANHLPHIFKRLIDSPAAANPDDLYVNFIYILLIGPPNKNQFSLLLRSMCKQVLFISSFLWFGLFRLAGAHCIEKKKASTSPIIKNHNRGLWNLIWILNNLYVCWIGIHHIFFFLFSCWFHSAHGYNFSFI